MDFLLLLLLSVLLDMEWFITYAVIMLPTSLLLYALYRETKEIKEATDGSNSKNKDY